MRATRLPRSEISSPDRKADRRGARVPPRIAHECATERKEHPENACSSMAFLRLSSPSFGSLTPVMRRNHAARRVNSPSLACWWSRRTS